jgi:GNAT superfamily N-acetyltransferase
MEKPLLDLKRATLADAWAVRDLVRGAYAQWVPVIGREPKPMGADYEAAVRDHLVDLLYVDFDLAGVIEMVPEAGQLLIENVAVAPAFRGRRLGLALLGHAESVARALGFSRLRLYTNQKFAANIGLYEGCGYAIDRSEPISDGVVIHMSKSLAT